MKKEYKVASSERNWCGESYRTERKDSPRKLKGTYHFEQ
jgi:hypothetical protein